MKVNYNWYQGLSGMGDWEDFYDTSDVELNSVLDAGQIQLDNGDILDLGTGIASTADGLTYVYGQASSDVTPMADEYVIPSGTPQEVAERAAAAVIANPSANIRLPSGVTSSVLSNVLTKLGTAAGNYVARQIGGSTLLVRKGNGIGTQDAKSFLMPLAIVAGLYILGR